MHKKRYFVVIINDPQPMFENLSCDSPTREYAITVSSFQCMDEDSRLDEGVQMDVSSGHDPNGDDFKSLGSRCSNQERCLDPYPRD